MLCPSGTTLPRNADIVRDGLHTLIEMYAISGFTLTESQATNARNLLYIYADNIARNPNLRLRIAPTISVDEDGNQTITGITPSLITHLGTDSINVTGTMQQEVCLPNPGDSSAYDSTFIERLTHLITSHATRLRGIAGDNPGVVIESTLISAAAPTDTSSVLQISAQLATAHNVHMHVLQRQFSLKRFEVLRVINAEMYSQWFTMNIFNDLGIQQITTTTIAMTPDERAILQQVVNNQTNINSESCDNTYIYFKLFVHVYARLALAHYGQVVELPIINNDNSSLIYVNTNGVAIDPLFTYENLRSWSAQGYFA